MGWVDPDTVPIPELVEGSFVRDGDVLDFPSTIVDAEEAWLWKKPLGTELDCDLSQLLDRDPQM